MKPDTTPVDLHTVKSEKMKNSVIDAIRTIIGGDYTNDRKAARMGSEDDGT